MVSLSPSSGFAESSFAEAVHSYKVPDKDEPKSRLTVSGFPSMLLDTMYYTLPNVLDVSWSRSHAEVERFLLGVGLPRLNEDTQPCRLFGDLLSEASTRMDYVARAKIAACEFNYNMNAMCVLGGREVSKGGTKVQALARDGLLVKDIAIRMGKMDTSPLVVLGIVYALSSDEDALIVPKSLVDLCREIVEGFRKSVGRWHTDLMDLRVKLCYVKLSI